MAKLVPLGSAETSRHLAKARGWLEDNDPFFDQIEAVVKSRARIKLRPKPRMRT